MRTTRRHILAGGVIGSVWLSAPGLARAGLVQAGQAATDLYPMGFKAGPVGRQLARVDKGAATGPFRPDWESLRGFRVADWFRDAKFGIFIHWGPYAVPGFLTEWYSRNMYDRGNVAFTYHRNVWGPQDKFGCKDFIPKFTAEHFDAEAWVALFKEAGARYVVPVAEHCDGFAMYDCAMTDWNAVRMGPRRDTADALMKAARKAGLHFGLSSHRAEHWMWFGPGRGYDSDVNDPRYAGLYGPAAPQTLPADAHGAAPDPSHLENWLPPHKDFLDDWLARTTEFIDKYRPEIIYLDWWTAAPSFEPYLQRLAAYYYNAGRRDGYATAITYKGEQFPVGTALFDVERGKLDALRLEPWQTDTSVSTKSWGYIQDDDFKQPKALVQDLIDIVAKNGNLLLNIGPRADGTIPEEVQATLRGIGGWLATHGEAIYGTRPWRFFGEGPTTAVAGEKKESANRSWKSADFRFTTKGRTLYAIGMERPANGTALIKTLYADTPHLDRPIAGVSLVGAGALAWRQDAQGLDVTLPDSVGAAMPYALKIDLG
ncbi:alpha-L-fucosidase [Novosphingobium rosa]|uniref:alpha-L-fucosidase n=1 Tax=Novosphingobium rosa TaxID=76978 RepID=UPI00082E1503|nr:alpha-L-fucosidase [Novosphingobium rosa]